MSESEERPYTIRPGAKKYVDVDGNLRTYDVKYYHRFGKRGAPPKNGQKELRDNTRRVLTDDELADVNLLKSRVCSEFPRWAALSREIKKTLHFEITPAKLKYYFG